MGPAGGEEAHPKVRLQHARLGRPGQGRVTPPPTDGRQVVGVVKLELHGGELFQSHVASARQIEEHLPLAVGLRQPGRGAGAARA